MFFFVSRKEMVDQGVDVYVGSNGESVRVNRDSTYDAAVQAAREALRRSKDDDARSLELQDTVA